MIRSQITTIIGVLISIFGALSAPDVLALIPAKYSAVITIVGVIVAAIGRSLLAPTNTPPANEVK